MSYSCISIPTCWLSSERLDEYNPLIKKNPVSQSSGMFVSYFTNRGEFCYSNDLFRKPNQEYICNSEDEFEQMIAQAKLEGIL